MAHLTFLILHNTPTPTFWWVAVCLISSKLMCFHSSFLAAVEKRALVWMAQRMPGWASSDHLTFLALPPRSRLAFATRLPAGTATCRLG